MAAEGTRAGLRGPMAFRAWLCLALDREVRLRSLRVAALVGTLLVLINHGWELLQGPPGATVLVEIGLTYLVPYAVTTYASVEQRRVDQETG